MSRNRYRNYPPLICSLSTSNSQICRSHTCYLVPSHVSGSHQMASRPSCSTYRLGYLACRYVRARVVLASACDQNRYVHRSHTYVSPSSFPRQCYLPASALPWLSARLMAHSPHRRTPHTREPLPTQSLLMRFSFAHLLLREITRPSPAVMHLGLTASRQSRSSAPLSRCRWLGDLSF